MAKPSDLKIFLESSLNEIFKATVSDILDSVDRTLSEYQGTIHRIESENEGLKRLLLAQRSTESAARDPREQDATERFSFSEWNDYPFGSTQGTFKMSICSSDKKSFRRKQKDKTRENTSSSSFLLQPDHMEETQCVSTADVGIITQNVLSVKTEPGLDESGAIDLSQPSSLLNLTMKTESTEVNISSHDAYAPMPPPTGLEQDSRGSDSEVKVNIVSDTYMQDGQLIKTEEEQNGVSQYDGDNDNLLLKQALRYNPESEIDPEAASTQVVEPEVESHEENAAVPELLEVPDNFLRCPTCPKTFSRASSLNIHIKTHSAEKAHSCSYCGKRFGRADLLKSHKRTHTGERPYCCNICSKTLKLHQRTHTGEKEYSCSFCSKSFSRSGHLKRHELVHTKEKVFLCSQCGKTYTDQSSLKKHLKMHATKEQKAQSEGSTSETETNRPSASETLSDTDRS
ncbi:Zinc finger protein 22 [Dissostichus eleginoides]|uniref:Zinc finger protein 22 n=1 Tax=Dissostichus eleginoides TaxID=100907 RepID=A0AAD9EZT5_DISEL|nr:Zinc finger protein 22 [Dissostichus eleginoides]